MLWKQGVEVEKAFSGRSLRESGFVMEFLRRQYNSPSAVVLHIAFFVANLLYVCMHGEEMVSLYKKS